MAQGRTPPHRESLVLEPSLTSVRKIRDFVGRIGREAGLSSSRIFDVKVAVSEACANAIEHGRTQDRIEVTVRTFPDRLEVDVASPQPFLVPSPERKEKGRHRGLGLPIMASLSDHLAVYTTTEGGTLITLTFYRPSVPHVEPETTTPPSLRDMLEESSLMSSIVDTIPTYLFVLDHELRFLWGNRSFVQVIREPYRTTGIVGECLTDVVPDSVRGSVLETLKSVSHGGRRWGPNERELRRADGTILQLVWQAVPLVRDKPEPPYDVLVIVSDETAQKRAEGALRRSEEQLKRDKRLLEGIERILAEALRNTPEEQLGKACLEVAQEVTGSKIGFIGELNASGRLFDIAMTSSAWEACRVQRKNTHTLPGDLMVHGIYGRVVLDGRSVIANDPSSHPDRIGLPTGHPPLSSFLGTPLKTDGRTMGVIAVGNRAGGYRPEHQEALEQLAPIVVEAFQRKRAAQSLRESEERFRAMFERHTAVMLLVDPEDGSIVDANRSAVNFYGYPHDRLVQMRIQDINLLSAEEVARRRREAAAGQQHAFVFPHQLANSEVRWVEVYAAPTIVQGRTLLFSVIHDITERKRAEDATARQTRIVAAITEIFQEALRARTYEELQEMCISVAQRLTESAFGFIGEVGDDGRFKNMSLSHPGIWGGAAGRAGARPPADTLQMIGLYGKVVREGRGLYTNEPESHPDRSDLPPGHPHPSAFLGVPLKQRGRVTGLIALANRPGGYRQEDLDAVEALAPALVEALSKKRNEDEQRRIAERLQLAFLHVPASVGGLEIGHLYRSATEMASVGGDFYDVFPAREGSIAVLIGDVAGHGIEAARVATLSKDVIHAFCHESLRPDVVLRRTNGLLVETLESGFVTVFFGVLDLATGAFRYASAGHPQPMLRRRSGRVDLLDLTSLPLGVFPDALWKQGRTVLKSGDLLLLYTDGVTEARRDGRLFGEQALMDALVRHGNIPAESVPNAILREVLAFSGDILQDDAALLALKRA